MHYKIKQRIATNALSLYRPGDMSGVLDYLDNIVGLDKIEYLDIVSYVRDYNHVPSGRNNNGPNN